MAISGLVALPSDDPVWIGWTSKFALPSLLVRLFHDGFPGELFLRSDLPSWDIYGLRERGAHTLLIQ